MKRKSSHAGAGHKLLEAAITQRAQVVDFGITEACSECIVKILNRTIVTGKASRSARAASTIPHHAALFHGDSSLPSQRERISIVARQQQPGHVLSKQRLQHGDTVGENGGESAVAGSECEEAGGGSFA